MKALSLLKISKQNLYYIMYKYTHTYTDTHIKSVLFSIAVCSRQHQQSTYESLKKGFQIDNPIIAINTWSWISVINKHTHLSISLICNSTWLATSHRLLATYNFRPSAIILEISMAKPNQTHQDKRSKKNMRNILSTGNIIIKKY